MECRQFIKYIPPPPHSGSIIDNDGEIAGWKERMKYIFEDLNWLLRLSDAHFWNQVINDETFNGCIDSFLQLCPRFFEGTNMLPQCRQIQDKIKKLVLLVVLRLSSEPGEFKESFTSALYENYLLDIPKIMDICSIYGGMPEHTKNMISSGISTIFHQEQRYWADLETAIDSIFHTIDQISEKLGVKEDEDSLDPRVLQIGDTKSEEVEDYSDILRYIHDSAFTIASFLDLNSEASRMFLSKGAISRFAVVIDQILPALTTLVDSKEMKQRNHYLKRTSKYVVLLSHIILKTCFSSAGSSRSDQDLIQNQHDQYLQTILSLLPHSRFIRYYEKYHGIENDLLTITERALIDDDKTYCYIRSVLDSLSGPKEPRKVSHDQEAGAAVSLAEIEIQECIKKIRLVFPTEDDEFLHAFVVHRAASAEAVINDIFEENIPSFLQEIKERNRNDPLYFNAKSQSSGTMEIGSEKGNIPGVYYMKTEKVSIKEQLDVLNDKTHSKFVLNYIEAEKERQLKRDEIFEDWYAYDQYDDEYDDTYDSQNIGAMDADSRDELNDITHRRSFVKPRILQALEKKNDDEEDCSSNESESEIQKESTAGAKFPESNMRQRVFTGSYSGAKQRGPPSRNSQTQNKDEMSSQGNGRGRGHPARGGLAQKAKKHNRKAMARKKTSKGMGPV